MSLGLTPSGISMLDQCQVAIQEPAASANFAANFDRRQVANPPLAAMSLGGSIVVHDTAFDDNRAAVLDCLTSLRKTRTHTPGAISA